MLCNHWKNDTTRAAPTKDNGNSKRPFPQKIRRNERHARRIDEPMPDPTAEGLGQKDLPIRRGKRRREHARQPQRHASQHGREIIARVHGAAGKGADEEEQEQLRGHDPRDRGRGRVERFDVVGLEEAEAADVAPGIEHDKMAAEDLAPGLPAAIGRGSRVTGESGRQGWTEDREDAFGSVGRRRIFSDRTREGFDFFRGGKFHGCVGNGGILGGLRGTFQSRWWSFQDVLLEL